jgi:hypothetical protein
MEAKNYTGAVPENKEGRGVDATSVKECASVDDAKKLFATARERLLDVSCWQDLTTDALARFQLFDVYGTPVDGRASRGLLIRIDIPGPGTEVADGFDWVEIEEIKSYESDDIQSLAVRVRPSKAPGEEVTAHFYSKDSTSTFTITREYNTVTAAIYDRNLETNKEAESLIDKVRNAVTSIAGQAVFSKIQWKAFADGLIDAGNAGS